jgi:hypothetical protein
MTDEIINGQELQILLNMLDEVTISYPLYGEELVAAYPADDRYRLDIPAGREDFKEWALRFGDLAEEMPTYGDLLECMIASGIVGYDNRQKFEEMYGAYQSLKKDVFFGLDTNLFYQCFASNTPFIDPSRYLIVDIVRSEIEFAINRKYSARKIAEMIEHAPDQEAIIAEFENKRTKRSRKAAYLALSEFRSIRDRATEIQAPETYSRRMEENDLYIARALRKFEEERYALPVLLTADIYMADICDVEGLEYFFFERPYTINADYCKAGQFRRLIFTCAAVFGCIRCNSTLIFGEFGGKGTVLDELKLRFSDKQLQSDFRRELTLCRRLSALGIGR